MQSTASKLLLRCSEVGSRLSCRKECKSISRPAFTSTTTCHCADTQLIRDGLASSGWKRATGKNLLIKHAIQTHLLEHSRQFLALYLHRLKRNLCHLEQNNTRFPDTPLELLTHKAQTQPVFTEKFWHTTLTECVQICFKANRLLSFQQTHFFTSAHSCSLPTSIMIAYGKALQTGAAAERLYLLMFE